MVTPRFVWADGRPSGSGEAAGRPLRLGGEPVRRPLSHAAVDTERSLATVVHSELGIRCKAEDVTVSVNDQGGAFQRGSSDGDDGNGPVPAARRTSPGSLVTTVIRPAGSLL